MLSQIVGKIAVSGEPARIARVKMFEITRSCVNECALTATSLDASQQFHTCYYSWREIRIFCNDTEDPSYLFSLSFVLSFKFSLYFLPITMPRYIFISISSWKWCITIQQENKLQAHDENEKITANFKSVLFACVYFILDGKVRKVRAGERRTGIIKIWNWEVPKRKSNKGIFLLAKWPKATSVFESGFTQLIKLAWDNYAFFFDHRGMFYHLDTV